MNKKYIKYGAVALLGALAVGYLWKRKGEKETLEVAELPKTDAEVLHEAVVEEEVKKSLIPDAEIKKLAKETLDNLITEIRVVENGLHTSVVDFTKGASSVKHEMSDSIKKDYGIVYTNIKSFFAQFDTIAEAKRHLQFQKAMLLAEVFQHKVPVDTYMTKEVKIYRAENHGDLFRPHFIEILKGVRRKKRAVRFVDMGMPVSNNPVYTTNPAYAQLLSL